MTKRIPLSEFIEIYKESIIPSYFIQNFNNKQEFVKWLKKGTFEDIQSALEAFENEEMYHECGIIKEVIDEKLE